MPRATRRETTVRPLDCHPGTTSEPRAACRVGRCCWGNSETDALIVTANGRWTLSVGVHELLVSVSLAVT
jgi:hypothetical protein